MGKVLLQQLLYISVTEKIKKKKKKKSQVFKVNMINAHIWPLNTISYISLNKLAHPLPHKHIHCPVGDKKVTDLIYLLIYEIYFQLLSF